MKLSDILDQLSHGELSQVHVGGSDQCGVTEENRGTIVSHINMGLTELHKRFVLREGRFKIKVIPGKFTYLLDKKHSESNEGSDSPEKFIKDADDPFENDLFKVERVYDEKNHELALNDKDNELSLRTPSYNMLVIPDHKEFEAEELTVVYRANHPLLDFDDTVYPPEMVDVDLPMSHLEALLFYVAARVINPMGASGEFHEGNNYTSKFERAVQQLHAMNYRVDTQSSNTRFERNGWV